MGLGVQRASAPIAVVLANLLAMKLNPNSLFHKLAPVNKLGQFHPVPIVVQSSRTISK